MSHNNTENNSKLFETEDDKYLHKPNPKKEYRRKPKNAKQLEEWLDDDVDESVLKHIRHL